MSTNGFSRPFLKWAGGKAKIVPSLMEAIAELESHGARWQLTEEQRYHEPFLGSGALGYSFWVGVDLIRNLLLAVGVFRSWFR